METGVSADRLQVSHVAVHLRHRRVCRSLTTIDALTEA
jgi:hypothetical protein